MAAWGKKLGLPSAAEALPGRADAMPIAARHEVLGTALSGGFEGFERAIFAMGCFWGAEKCFWNRDGVHTTAVGYTAGLTPNPTYHEICSGRTGHTEGVLVVFDPALVTYADLLKTFWESHDPTQGMRQGNDVGTQYRSGIYWTTEVQQALAEGSREAYGKALAAAGFGAITTEIVAAETFYYAEADHQQYLSKVPSGYCGLGGTGVRFEADAA